jgi:hypothetical protein
MKLPATLENETLQPRCGKHQLPAYQLEDDAAALKPGICLGHAIVWVKW